MWFLIRLVFWLGLVFAKIDGPGEAVLAPDPAAVAGLAANGLASVCAAHPETCAQAAAKVEAVRRTRR
jgi:hypothetical protein